MSSWNTRSRWFCLVLVLALGTSGSARAQNAVLKLGDPGGAAIARPEPIDILSFSWGASRTPTMNMGPMDLSAVEPPPSARTVRILKRVDKSTPLIAQALARNERFPEATLTVPKGGGSQEYLEITMTDVIISSYQTGGTPDRPTESLSLNFTAIKFNYSEKKPAAPPGPAKAGYELKKVEEGVADPSAGPPAAAVADLLPLNGLRVATSFVPWGQTATISTDAASSKQAGRCFFRYRYDTENQGQVAAGAATNRIHLDAANGPSLADDALPGLGAGQQQTASGLLPLKEGLWTLYVHVDDGLVVAEGDEQNNLRRVRVRVEGSCEDEAPTLPAAVQAQEGQAVNDRPVVLGRVYNDPAPVDLLDPKGIEAAAGQEVAGRTSPSMQNDALSAARFSITVDGAEIASFSELTGISTSVELVTFVLKRGKATGPAMWAWHEAVQGGDMAAARKSASLVMYDYDGKPVARYHLESAWPSKVEIGGLAAQSNVSDLEFLKARASRGGEVAIKSITIVSERIQRVSF